MSLMRRVGGLAVAVGVAALLTGCATAAAPEPTGSAPASPAITLTDPWVKAADSGMSAAFGVLTNDSDDDVTVVAAHSPASARLELHETTAGADGTMAMREIDGGFTIPAGEDLTLEPGGNHLMFMDLTAPLHPGDDVSFTLTFADGSEQTFTAPVKDFAGANESYENHGSHG